MSGAVMDHFLNNPLYTKVIENNVHFNKSFGNPKKNMQKVLKEPKAAMFYNANYMYNIVEFECKVINIYITIN